MTERHVDVTAGRMFVIDENADSVIVATKRNHSA